MKSIDRKVKLEEFYLSSYLLKLSNYVDLNSKVKKYCVVIYKNLARYYIDLSNIFLNANVSISFEFFTIFHEIYVKVKRALNSRSKTLCVDLLDNMLCPLDMHGKALN